MLINVLGTTAKNKGMYLRGEKKWKRYFILILIFKCLFFHYEKPYNNNPKKRKKERKGKENTSYHGKKGNEEIHLT